jgi:hypothetical protein
VILTTWKDEIDRHADACSTLYTEITQRISERIFDSSSSLQVDGHIRLASPCSVHPCGVYSHVRKADEAASFCVLSAAIGTAMANM